MHIHSFNSKQEATAAAAESLANWLSASGVTNIMVAGGNSPLELYERIAQRRLNLSHLCAFALDEYVGVPLEEPRRCANLLRRAVAEAWGVAQDRYFAPSSLPAEAAASIREHERRIETAGGLDIAILGLGQNGHLGFNEPGSGADSAARVVELESVSTEANRQWFKGRYAPAQGATVGLRTILAARRVMVLAYGNSKVAAVKAMVKGPVSSRCPASFLQQHHDAHLFLDPAAAAGVDAGGQ